MERFTSSGAAYRQGFTNIDRASNSLTEEELLPAQPGEALSINQTEMSATYSTPSLNLTEDANDTRAFENMTYNVHDANNMNPLQDINLLGGCDGDGL